MLRLRRPMPCGAHLHSTGPARQNRSIRHSIGPIDARFAWKKNGQNIARVNEQTHALADGRKFLLSWVKDTVTRDSEYCCLVLSKTGNEMSKVDIRVEGNSHNSWSRELSSWKSVISKHEKMMENWEKTWESCNKKGKIQEAKKEWEKLGTPS